MESTEGGSRFLHSLKSQFGSTEEFCEFEREYYGQREEKRVLRQNVDTLRTTVVKLQEEKRALELLLVTERASREQDSKNAISDLENNNMQLNTQIYSIKCEVEMWKRKAEAITKESGWLKEQIKTIEIEKTEAMRRVEELTRLNNGAEQHRGAVEAYLKRHKETLADIQVRMMELEKAREAYAVLIDNMGRHQKFIEVNMKSWKQSRQLTDSRIRELEKELIEVKGQLVQNKAELGRTKTLHSKTEQLVNKLVVENKDLNEGFSVLLPALDMAKQAQLESETDITALQRIPHLHEEIMKDLVDLTLLDAKD